MADASPVADGVNLALVLRRPHAGHGRAAAAATVSGLVPGRAVDATIGEELGARAGACACRGPAGRRRCWWPSYPRGRIDDRIDAVRLKLLVPLALLAGLVAALALLAADRISRALSELSKRALTLVRSETPLPPPGGDELEQLSVALDTMSQPAEQPHGRARGASARG